MLAVASVLKLPARDALDAAGYFDNDAGLISPPAPPQRPLIATLPFDQLTSEQFEAACAVILEHLYPEAHASRYGGSGERQEGIDILLDGELRAIAQCKRHKQFGPSDVKAAVQAVTIPAPVNYLFLSRRTATAAARAEMARHQTWELWDGEDLSRYVSIRMSDSDSAIRFVDAYFPNYREPFLGVPQPGPWLTIQEFYAPTSGDKPYNHDWDLVGRQAELTELQAALESSDCRVAILFGRGGIGKTRLLRSIAESFEAKQWEVRLLSAGLELVAASFERLGSRDPALLIIDDAHDRTDVGNIVARIRSRNQDARVLIASRPYGERSLDYSLRSAGILMSDPDLYITNIDELPQDQAVALASEALGPDHSRHADRLGALTRDCPLVTTVGGYLIRRGVIDPRKLEQDELLRREVLIGFRDALLADRGDEDRRMAIIDAVSALQPFRTDNPEFKSAIAELVGIPYARLQRDLRSLEDSGLLMRRGPSLRLVPDLLGDVLLADVAYDRRGGSDTGYLAELLGVASGGALTNVFVNLSRVDWQVGRGLTDLITPLWNLIQQDLEKRDIATYLQVLAISSRVAPFQPVQVIKTVRWILDHPVEVSSQAVETPLPFQWTWRHVVDEIPGVLRAAANTLVSFRESCTVLWELAQNDQRPTHHYPNHPLRVLSELAEYAPQKPVAYNEAILDLAESWADHAPNVSPLKVIEGLVATEGSAHQYSRSTHMLSFHPFALRQDIVRPVRRGAITLALNEIRSGDYQRGVAGAQFIQRALRYPTGSFSRDVSVQERESWEPDFLETIAELEVILRSKALDPVVCVAILQALHSHRGGYGSSHTKRAVEEAISALPDSVEFEIALLVHDGWGALVREARTDFEQHQLATSARLLNASTRAISEFDDRRLVQLLEERISRERLAFGGETSGGQQLLGALAKQRSSVIEAVAKQVVERSQSPLQMLIPHLISLVGLYRPTKLMGMARQLLAHESSDIQASAAVGLARRDRSVCELCEGELELLKQFAVNRVVAVRLSVLEATRSIAATEPHQAAELLAQIRFSDSSEIARELLMSLDRDVGNLTWARLTSEHQSTVLSELTGVPDISDPWVTEFLSHLATNDPRAVLALLRQRIELAEGAEKSRNFHPVPYQWTAAMNLQSHPEFVELLRDLLLWLGEDDAWERAYYGRTLFAAVAGSFEEPVLALLLEALRLGSDADARTVAAVLQEAPNDFVFEHVDFVIDALALAAQLGRSALKAMHTSLYISATSGIREGAPGEPFPEDVRLRDECAAIADAPSITATAAAFYRDLSESGARAVMREIEQDRADHRVW